MKFGQQILPPKLVFSTLFTITQRFTIFRILPFPRLSHQPRILLILLTQISFNFRLIKFSVCFAKS